jgi:kynurenine formamidase
MDPPSHFARDGRTQDEVGVEEMILPLVVVDAREACAADPDFACTRATIEAWEAEHGRVPAGAFVALHTGWDARWPDGDAMQNRGTDGLAHYPGWAVDALELLVEGREITAIGHDMTDTDPGARLSAGESPAEAYSRPRAVYTNSRPMMRGWPSTCTSMKPSAREKPASRASRSRPVCPNPQ